MKRRFIAFAALTVLAVGALAGSGCVGAGAKAPAEIKIGVIAPLTGNIASFGQSTKNGLDLLVKDVNSKGGILGKQVRLIYEDDRNDPVETANATRKLITQDKVVAIIGSVTSKCTLAGAPIAQSSGVPMLSPTSTNENVTKVGDFISRACFIDPFQGTVMAKFATETLKAKTAGVIFDIGNDYSKGLAEAFKLAFEQLGGQVVAWETYAEGDQVFSAQLTRVRSKQPDVLFQPDYYHAVTLISKQARQAGITATFLGGDGWDAPETAAIGGAAVEGAFFANHYSPDSTDPVAVAFISAYKAAYGSVPDALAALAYDAGLVMFDAIKRAGSTDGKAIKDAVIATRNLRAVSGAINMNASRDPVKGAAIIKLVGGKQVFAGTVNP
ncbi:MAG: ABC transporter substrate-binding protein [Bacillota bacterium]